jgi:hypothetical protein
MQQEVNEVLRHAIEGRHLVRFTYKGKERIVEPHDYGMRKGIDRLLCWQIGGQSGSPIPGWRLIDVADMQDCEMLDQQFSGAREVPGRHHQWDKVFIRVVPSRSQNVPRTH